MRKTSPILAAVALLAPLTFADAPPAPNTPPPASTTPAAPAADDVPALIARLGDDSPKVREDASQKLRQLGAAAVPALTDAQKSADPEVSTRAQAILRGIEDDRRPKPPQPDLGRELGFRDNKFRLQLHAADVAARPGVGAKTVSVAHNPDGTTTRVTTVNDGDQKVTIREDAAGVAVTTTRTVDGKDVEQTVKARDRTALKLEHPDAFALVEKHTRQSVKLRGAVGGGAAFEFDHPNPADRAKVDAAVAEARKLADEMHRNLAADGLIDARTQLELLRAVEQARLHADQHRKVMEEQMRAARQQLEAVKRQHQQQVEEIKRQQREQLENPRRID